MKKFAVLSFAALTFSGLASASIIPFLASGPTASGNASNPFQVTYSATLSSDERLDTAATNGPSCGGVACNPPGTFFTIYDIPGSPMPVVTGSGTPAGFTSSVQLTGVTPGGIVPTDSGSLHNVTFMYTGGVVAGPVTFTGFTIQTTGNALNNNGQFSFQATKNTFMPNGTTPSPDNGTTDNGKGFLPVPVIASVPEPSSMLLIGGGLVGLGFLRRKLVRS